MGRWRWGEDVERDLGPSTWLRRLRSVTDLGLLWQLQFSVAEGGAKGKACTLKLKARLLKLFKLTLCLPLSCELSRTVEIFESDVLERWEGAKRGLLLVIPAGPPALPALGGQVISAPG